MVRTRPESVRARITEVSLRASYHLGIPRLLSVMRRGGVRFLIYHGIATDHRPGKLRNVYGYSIPTGQLAEHLHYLTRRCNVVSLDDVSAGRRLSRTRANVVLTFDDGYESHYVEVFPLLKSYDLPAVFGIPTAFVLRREPLWDDRVEFMVRRCPLQRVEILWDNRGFPFDLSLAAGRQELHHWVMRQSTEMAQERRDAFVAAVAEALGVGECTAELLKDPEYRPLTPSQIREMLASGLVEIASHSVNHYLLARCSPDTLRAELIDSKLQIERLTGLPCRTLALPGGSYDRNVVAEAFGSGYQRVMRSDFGPHYRDPRFFTRYGVFLDHDRYRFADLVHGPVTSVFGLPRRIYEAYRARRSNGGSRGTV